jgi:hypothetical protein
MATVYLQLHPRAAIPDSSTGAQHDVLDGTNFPIPVLAYDTTTEEQAYWTGRAYNYGSGDITIDIDWYADTASSGVVRWGTQIAMITPNTDSDDIETYAFATATEADDTHLGTTGQRLHRATITSSNTDGVAADDWFAFKLYRDVGDAADTMAGDAFVALVTLSYSDT